MGRRSERLVGLRLLARVRVVTVDEELLAAVEEGNSAGVLRALAAGPSPDASTAGVRGGPVLTTAARRGDLEIVSALLDAGASPDPTDAWEWTPLRAAATFGRARVVDRLLRSGVDPNRDNDRGSILEDALSGTRHRPTPESMATVEVLLRAGAALGQGDHNAVLRCVERDWSAAVLRKLIEHGGDPDARRSDGTPAIVIAAMRKNLSLVETLISAAADVDAGDAHGRNALMHASERGADAVVAALLCAGADPEIRAADGATAHALAIAWNRQVIRLMLGDESGGSPASSARCTAVERRAMSAALRADPVELRRLGVLVAHALTELGEAEFRIVIGYSPEEAAQVAERLTNDWFDDPSFATLKRIELSEAEIAVLRGALLNVSYGPPMEMPLGMTRAQIADIYEDLFGRA